MDYQKIYDLLLEVHSDQKSLHNRCEKIEEKLDAVAADTRYFNSMLAGNGRPGIIARINIIEADMESIKKPSKKGVAKKLIGMICLVCLVGIGVAWVSSSDASTPSNQSQSRQHTP